MNENDNQYPWQTQKVQMYDEDNRGKAKSLEMKESVKKKLEFLKERRFIDSESSFINESVENAVNQRLLEVGVVPEDL